jgi:hypothetical protein
MQNSAFASTHQQVDTIIPASWRVSGNVRRNAITVSLYEAALLKALRSGANEHEAALRAARIHLQRKALGSRIRASLELTITSLQARNLVAVEGSELFVIGDGKDAVLSVADASRRRRRLRY